MANAILKQPEPKNCFECVLSFKRNGTWLCAGTNIKVFIEDHLTSDKRPEFCPLVIEDSN